MAFSYRTRDGGDAVIPIRYLPAAAGKTFKQGEPVNVESGLLDNGAPGDTAFAGITNKAYSTATVAGERLEVIMALPDVIFEVPYVGTTKTTLSNADLGTAFNLSATDNGKIDLDNTTNGAWVCVGFDNTKQTALVKCAKRSPIIG